MDDDQEREQLQEQAKSDNENKLEMIDNEDEEEEEDDDEDEDDDEEDEEYEDEEEEDEDEYEEDELKVDNTMNDRNDEAVASAANDQVMIDNFNETTSKFLNMLGEDLLMEEQDILISNKSESDLKSANKSKKDEDESEDENLNEDDDDDDDSESESENREYFEERFKLAKVDLMSVVEQLNRTIESERSEKNRLKIRLNNLLQENKNKSSLLTQYEQERAELVKEVNSLRTSKSREIKRLHAELEAITREYSQIMSERDMVHKEMEALQEQLSKAQDRLKKYARESALITTTAAAQAQAVIAAHNESVNNYNELNLTGVCAMSPMGEPEISAASTARQNKVNSLMFGYASIMDESLEIDALRQQINMLTRQRDDAVSQIKELYYQMGKNTDQIPDYSGSEYVDRFLAEKILNNNITNNPNNPEYENEKLKFELKELAKEIENAKKRRDMAFNERDKMIKERESIRALLDDMRHQRDKAISELAESISECDELRKQKTHAYRQIQVLEKNLAVMEEKLAYFREIHELKEDEHEKHDDDVTKKSFDSDDLNWKTLKIEIDLTENADLGIELAYASKLIEKLDVNDELDKSLSEMNNFPTSSMSPKLHKVNNLNVYDDHSLERKSIVSKLHKTHSESNVNEEHDTKDEKLDVNQYDEIAQLEEDASFMPMEDKIGQDEFILISDIDENGLAYGKLKMFDRLLKINDIDVQKSTAEEIKDIILSSKNTISFIVSRHFGKSSDCLIRKSSTQHLNEDNDSEEKHKEGVITSATAAAALGEEEDIDEEIISTSMSLITTSTSNSNLQLPITNTKTSTFYSHGSHDESTFKFDRTDINRYKQQQQQQLNQKESPRSQKRQSNHNSKHKRTPSDNESQDSNSLDLISINKSSLNDLLLETGVYVSNIVRKQNSELKIGDRILSINGHSLTNKTLYEIMDLINNSNKFNLVVKKNSTTTTTTTKTTRSSKKRSRKSPTPLAKNPPPRGFIVVSKSNLSQSSSASLLNETIRNRDDELNASSNLIFGIKDQKEVKKQIDLNNKAMRAIKQQQMQLVNEVDLERHQKQCKQYFSKQLETLDEKEQHLLDENLLKYQDLIRNFHMQSRQKSNHLFVDIDIQAAEQKRNSKSSLIKFHKTSPRVVEDLDKAYLSDMSATAHFAVLDSATNKNNNKRMRKKTSAPTTDTMKFNYRRSSQNQDNNLNLF